jgi:membrane protein
VLRVRHLLPGALIYAVAMSFLRPASGVFLPQALQTSASRYGSIGVAFTYLAWLYAIAWVLLLAAVLGAVIVKDRGKVGSWLRGPVEPGTPVQRPEPENQADPEMTGPGSGPAAEPSGA